MLVYSNNDTEIGKIREEGSLERLFSIIKRLRGPGGCPWDKNLTYQTLTPFVLEEAYEVVQAAQETDADKLKEELGDLLLEIGLYAAIAEEKKHFTFVDVIDGISDKLVRRHPHVFGNLKAETPEQVERLWEEVKRKERGKSSWGFGIMGSVGRGLPALMRADEQQKAAAANGFDWPHVSGVFEKVDEEVAELKEALEKDDGAQIEAEMGDLLFACVNLARHLGVDAEVALTCANDKFSKRLNLMEAYLKERGLTMKEVELGLLDDLWEKVKVGEDKGDD